MAKPYLPATLRVLHVCGGDPKSRPYSLFETLCSPRMWR